jgi:hypothetical protein
MDVQILIYLLQYINISWPHRYPDKILLYIELLDSLLNLSNFSSGKFFNLKNLMVKIINCTADMNFLVI